MKYPSTLCALAILITSPGILHAQGVAPVSPPGRENTDLHTAAARWPRSTILVPYERLAERVTKEPGNPKLTSDLQEHENKWTTALGAGWRERLMNSSHEREADELADIYTEGRSFQYRWSKASVPARRKLIDYIAAKPVLDVNDLTVIRFVCNARMHSPAIEARMDDLLALLPAGLESHYKRKYNNILGMSEAWPAYMLPEEWMALSAGTSNPEDPGFSVSAYGQMRNHLLAMVTRVLIEKREAAGESIEGEGFDAALAPVVTALNAPLFAGLQDACAGLPINLPVPDYSAAIARSEQIVDKIERHSMTKKRTMAQLGTVMFVKGVAAYDEWRVTFNSQSK